MIMSELSPPVAAKLLNTRFASVPLQLLSVPKVQLNAIAFPACRTVSSVLPAATAARGMAGKFKFINLLAADDSGLI